MLTRDGEKDLEFKLSWSQDRVDKWFRRLFPQAFEWMDRRYGQEEGKVHWVLTRKQWSTIYVLQHKTFTGDGLYAARGTTARNYMDYCIRFGKISARNCDRLDIGLRFPP